MSLDSPKTLGNFEAIEICVAWLTNGIVGTFSRSLISIDLIEFRLKCRQQHILLSVHNLDDFKLPKAVLYETLEMENCMEVFWNTIY